jgi:hypothetical protein
MMTLIRNQTTDGTCKYALVRLDKIKEKFPNISKEDILKMFGFMANYIEIGEPQSEEEFFAIKLKDVASTPALVSYSDAIARQGYEQMGKEVLELAQRSGENSPFCHKPT